MTEIPKREHFLKPVLQAMIELGGSGSNEEINDKVIALLNIPESLLSIMHGNTPQSELAYQLAWVRTMLKNQGLIENSQRGIWSVVDIEEAQLLLKKKGQQTLEQRINQQLEEDENWKEKILSVILEKVSPSGFERLIQLFLREKGFTQVEVTGRSGDGGIDGRGIAKINGILSFHIIFQCKRYKGKVSSKEIRDFRGAMVGRTDKGLFITTGDFTRDAFLEATRDGVQTIDLIDGEKLAEKLKELNLGVKIEHREIVTVDEEWFNRFD
jgi:restriction system protein